MSIESQYTAGLDHWGLLMIEEISLTNVNLYYSIFVFLYFIE